MQDWVQGTISRSTELTRSTLTRFSRPSKSRCSSISFWRFSCKLHKDMLKKNILLECWHKQTYCKMSVHRITVSWNLRQLPSWPNVLLSQDKMLAHAQTALTHLTMTLDHVCHLFMPQQRHRFALIIFSFVEII